MNFLKKIMSSYVSPIDQFLQQYDQSHQPSPSQQAEIEKYKKLNALRDQST